MKKEIQKVKAIAEKEWTEISGLETEINKQVKESMKLMRKATKSLSTLTIVTILVFIAALVDSFLLRLTGQLRFLEGGIDFMVIGIGSLVFNWFSLQGITSDMAEMLEHYLFLNSHIATGRLEFKNMKEDFKLSFAIRKGMLD